MKFLLVEDDQALASAIEQLLSEHHYVMDLATDGIMGRDMAEAFPYDFILLDWTLPKLNGVELCKYLRNEGNYTPIILMTARDASRDKVTGLDSGADDYLVKPFEFEELLARIRALLRRAEGIASPVLQWGDLCLDPRSGEVSYRDQPIAVTPKEYALLELFLRNPSRIFSLDNLLDKVWAYDDTPNVGSVRTHIKGLRQKLKKAGLTDIITTVYGLGYRLNTGSNQSVAQSTSQSVSQPSHQSGHLPPSSQNKADSCDQTSNQNGSSQASTADDTLAPAQNLLLNMSALWQSVSQSYLRRVNSVANTIRGLYPGLIDKSVREHLLTEAHSLAGSLGSFGFESVTTQFREIERIFRANAYLSAEHMSQLEAAIGQVQRSLEQGITTDVTTDIATSGTTHSTPHSTPVATARPNAGASQAHPSTASSPTITTSASVPISVELLPGQLFQILMVEKVGETNPEWLSTLEEIASRYQMQISRAKTLEQARNSIFPPAPAATTVPTTRQPTAPHLVVFDFDGSHELPESSSNEFQLLADMQAAQPPIPNIVLTAATSFENRVRAARAGVDRLLQVPVAPTDLLEAAAQVLRKGVPPTAKLLIVDDDESILMLLQNLLQPWGFQLRLLSDPQAFWQTLEGFEPDLVLLDVKMPNISGFELCQVLRNAPRWHELPVLFMSGYTDAETIQQVFSVGADDYVRKPIVAPELVARVLGWLERSRTRKLLSDVDSLTGVTNRRKSTQSLNRLLGLAQRQGQTLCFAVLDLDNFKKINDRYGHPVGDQVLKQFGEKLQSTFRDEDVIARWGGEEFIVGLYSVSRQEGVQRLQQFLKNWQTQQFTSQTDAAISSTSEANGTRQTSLQSKPTTFKVAFSAGVAVYPHDATDLQGLYRAADKALYKAKATGRSQVIPAA